MKRYIGQGPEQSCVQESLPVEFGARPSQHVHGLTNLKLSKYTV